MLLGWLPNNLESNKVVSARPRFKQLAVASTPNRLIFSQSNLSTQSLGDYLRWGIKCVYAGMLLGWFPKPFQIPMRRCRRASGSNNWSLPLSQTDSFCRVQLRLNMSQAGLPTAAAKGSATSRNGNPIGPYCGSEVKRCPAPVRFIQNNYFRTHKAVDGHHIASLLGADFEKRSKEEVQGIKSTIESEKKKIKMEIICPEIRKIMLSEAMSWGMKNKKGERVTTFHEIGEDFAKPPCPTLEQAQHLYYVQYGVFDRTPNWTNLIEKAVLENMNWKIQKDDSSTSTTSCCTTSSRTTSSTHSSIHKVIIEAKNEIVKNLRDKLKRRCNYCVSKSSPWENDIDNSDGCRIKKKKKTSKERQRFPKGTFQPIYFQYFPKDEINHTSGRQAPVSYPFEGTSAQQLYCVVEGDGAKAQLQANMPALAQAQLAIPADCSIPDFASATDAANAHFPPPPSISDCVDLPRYLEDPDVLASLFVRI